MYSCVFCADRSSCAHVQIARTYVLGSRVHVCNILQDVRRQALRNAFELTGHLEWRQLWGLHHRVGPAGPRANEFVGSTCWPRRLKFQTACRLTFCATQDRGLRIRVQRSSRRSSVANRRHRRETQPSREPGTAGDREPHDMQAGVRQRRHCSGDSRGRGTRHPARP